MLKDSFLKPVLCFLLFPPRSFIVVRPTPSPVSNDKQNNTARCPPCLWLISDSLTLAFICSFIQLISVVHLLHRRTILEIPAASQSYVFHKRMSFLKADTGACSEKAGTWDPLLWCLHLDKHLLEQQNTKKI